MHFHPGRMEHYRPWVEEGFRRAQRAGRDKGWHNFEVQASAFVAITEDVGSALARLKPGIALYVGGMGHRDVNFHNQHMTAMGYGDAAARVQELFLAGRKQEAADAVPDDYVDERALLGSPQRLRSRYAAWARSGITGLTLNTSQATAIALFAEFAREQAAEHR